MPQNDNRNRQRGGSQQQAYSQNERQQGWHETSRQPQGDYGWGRDHAPLGSGNDNDWRRQQDNLGAYRDSESRDDWRDARNAQVPYHPRDQDDRYGQYGLRRSSGGGQQDRWDDNGDYGPFGRDYGYGMRDRDEQRHRAFDQQERDRSQRPSGLDRDYRGASYAGPGGYGGGYGSSYSGSGQGRERDREQGHDADYSQWRREQLRALDDDYDQWRQDRFKKFSDEFTTWRSSRSQQQNLGKDEAGSTPGKKKDPS
ncbi:hypothetical protein [Hydrogenophaga laconesensis]|uniref:Uncharacterized protein n=1 Tax=Hydrogenophaga laconesensis TaxID=1805971 RepID=A0ABU1V5F5_9BURK|nr:hypothetical protein [Hydrogenophaga laconesensis]MDR7092635.1 hypothetical protein [Hydrogenophaga laconesensis]